MIMGKYMQKVMKRENREIERESVPICRTDSNSELLYNLNIQKYNTKEVMTWKRKILFLS